MYIASNVKDPIAVLTMPNRAKRTALHLACMMSEANVALVEFLTLACPDAAGLTDKDGMTPLHHALTVEGPVLAVIEDLTGVCPAAVCVRATNTGSTPLHLALQNSTYADETVATDILKDLVASNPLALQLQDAVAGNTPLHAAVVAGRRIKDIKLMFKKYTFAAAVANAKGETPYKIAKALKAEKDVLKLLKPTEMM